METTERVVEAYYRYIENCATMPNVRCEGQHELDLLAINLKTHERFHIETSVSISKAYRKLTAKEFDLEKSKARVGKAPQRRTIGFFVQQKFTPKKVLGALEKYGFVDGNYSRVIVAWDWTMEAEKVATQVGIKLLSFQTILLKLSKEFKDDTKYFTDDTLRTLHLYQLALGKSNDGKKILKKN